MHWADRKEFKRNSQAAFSEDGDESLNRGHPRGSSARAGRVWSVCGCAQYSRTEKRGSQSGVVAGGYCAAAKSGPDPEPGGNRERIRAAGANSLRRHRQGAVGTAFGGEPPGEDRGEPATGRRAGTLVACGGELSPTEVEREFSSAAGRAGGNRESRRGGT